MAPKYFDKIIENLSQSERASSTKLDPDTSSSLASIVTNYTTINVLHISGKETWIKLSTN